MEKKYRALRTIATIYKILGTIVGVLTVIASIGICAITLLGGAMFSDMDMGGMGGGVLVAIPTFLGLLVTGGGAAVTFFAVGEGIYVFLDMEENTREMAHLLRLRQQPSVQPPTQPPVA